MQRDCHAIDRLDFVRFLCAVAVLIQVDKVANRAQRLEMNRMVGLVICGQRVADRGGIGGVGDRSRRIRNCADGNRGASMGQEAADGASKAAACQVTAAAANRIEKYSRWLAVGDHYPGDGHCSSVLDSELIDKGRTNRHRCWARFGERDITHCQCLIVCTRGSGANRAVAAGEGPFGPAGAINAIFAYRNTLPAFCAGGGIGLEPVGIWVDRATAAISHIIEHAATGIRASVQGKIITTVIELQRATTAIKLEHAIAWVKVIDTR